MSAKKQASEEYVDKIADHAMNVDGEELGKSPIETVFKMNLKSGLVEFEKYFEKLNAEKESCFHKIKAEAAMKAIKSPELKDEIEQARENRIEEAGKRFDQCIQDLITQYDDHMGKVIPNPNNLEVRISV